MWDSCPGGGARTTAPLSIPAPAPRSEGRPARGFTRVPRVPARATVAGAGAPRGGEQGGPQEELEADERRAGVPGQSEAQRPSANAEGDGLAGPDGDPPEDLLDSQLRLGRTDEVVHADRDAAARDEDV